MYNSSYKWNRKERKNEMLISISIFFPCQHSGDMRGSIEHYFYSLAIVTLLIHISSKEEYEEEEEEREREGLLFEGCL